MDVPDRRTTVVRRALLAACLALAPVAIALSGLFSTGSADDGAEEYDLLLADRTEALTGIGLFGLGAALLVPGSIGIAQLVRGRGSGLLTTGAAMIGVGGLAMVAGATSYGMTAYLLTESGVATDAGRQVFDFAYDDTITGLPWAVGMGALLGFVVVGIALLRVRAIERWKAALLVVAPFVVFGVESDGWLSVLANLPLVVALAAVADRVRRVDDPDGPAPAMPAQRTTAAQAETRAPA